MQQSMKWQNSRRQQDQLQQPAVERCASSRIIVKLLIVHAAEDRKQQNLLPSLTTEIKPLEHFLHVFLKKATTQKLVEDLGLCVRFARHQHQHHPRRSLCVCYYKSMAIWLSFRCGHELHENTCLCLFHQQLELKQQHGERIMQRRAAPDAFATLDLKSGTPIENLGFSQILFQCGSYRCTL